MFAEGRLVQVRAGGLLAEANRRADVAAVQIVALDHPPGNKVRMRKRFRERVDAAVADIEFRKIGVPLGERFSAKFGREEINHRLLVRARPAQAQSSEVRTAEGAEQVMNEFCFLPGEDEVAAVLRLVRAVEGSAAGGPFMRRDRLAIFRESGPAA